MCKGCWMEMKENNCLKEPAAEAMGLQTALHLLRFSLWQSQKLWSWTTFDPVSLKAAGLWFRTVVEQTSYGLQGFDLSPWNSDINLRAGSTELKVQAHGTRSSKNSSFQVVLILLMLIGGYLSSSEIVSPDLVIPCT